MQNPEPIYERNKNRCWKGVGDESNQVLEVRQDVPKKGCAAEVLDTVRNVWEPLTMRMMGR